jgi:hypothetical protein
MAMSSDSDSGWRAGFKTDYQAIFVEEWSPFVGAMLLVLAIIGLMLSGLVWGVFGGVKFWGDWFNNLIGLGPGPRPAEGTRRLPDAPHVADEHHAGGGRLQCRPAVAPVQSQPAAAGSNTSGQPPVAPARHRRRAGRWLHHGGLLQSRTAFLARRVGPCGSACWLGAAIGVKLLLWTLDNIEWGMQAPPRLNVSPAVRQIYPLFGLGVIRRRPVLGHAVVRIRATKNWWPVR